MRRSLNIPRLGTVNEQPTNVYISPVNLTANGRAHLGHAAGPFLRMDILQKHLKRAGHCVRSGLTTDGFENHVLVRAAKENVDPSNLAHGYFLKIVEDLASIGIRFDRFDDPAYGRNMDTFSSVSNELMSSLLSSGSVEFREGRIPIDIAKSATTLLEECFCIGGWFGATCPLCSAPAGSFFCEQCGYHFEPYEAVNPFSRRAEIIGWKDDISAYLSFAQKDLLSQAWSDMAIEGSFREIGERYITYKGQQMRLTVPGIHGLHWPSAKFVSNQILFSYSSLLYAHSLYCGQKDSESNGNLNPFVKDADTFLIGATGIDNTVPMLVGVTGCALGQNSFRSFDRIYFNHFLRLNGSKFSTSRGHVIWAGDIARIPSISVDILRMYLSEICPEDAETDLVSGHLVDRYNELLKLISGCVDDCSKSIASVPADTVCDIDETLFATLSPLYEMQCKALSLDHLRVSQASSAVLEWARRSETRPSPYAAYSWLMGFSVLAWPLMPQITESVWRWLGHTGHPNVEHALRPSTERVGRVPQMEARRLTTADLDGCLPQEIAA
ncbi:class I tRNA ligase family protein [Agrobacterium tumefaciens]|uniref:class I tRNA ligase family protein n=1 Tax=Agrobacterium tumefaciens TaxID=358 RepID=UPI0009770CF4|nr:hypothetical protein BV900_22260 [Agrobacterium tumefaciens]